MALRSRTFSRRLRWSLAAMLLPLTLIAAIALVHGRSSADRQTDVAEHASVQGAKLTATRNALRQLEGIAVAAYVKAPGAQFLMRARRSAVDATMARLTGFEGEERRLVGESRAAWKAAGEQLDAVLAGEEGTPGPYPLMGFHASIHTADTTLGAVQRSELDAVRRESAAAKTSQHRISFVMLALLLVAFVGAVVIARRLSRDVRRSVEPLRDGARRFGDGDLSFRVSALHDQEFDELAQAFNGMADRVLDSHDELLRQAHHDGLTGLPNRALLLERVRHAAARARRADAPPILGLVLLDVDGFKTINDTLGHSAGDALLVAVAKRLEAHVRPSDTVVRLGGDEFAVLLEDVESAQAAEAGARRVLEALAEPVTAAARDLAVTVSAGLVTAPAAGADAEALLRDADVAMYRAKANGRARLEIFEAWMQVDVERRLRAEQELGRAIADGELELHHQLIVDLGTARPLGLESLVRWRHRERGLVPPMEFIPLAEESGLIVDLGRWVLEQSITELLEINAGRRPGDELYASVNVSPRQLRDATFAALVAAQIDRLGGRGDLLVLEVTEHAFIGNLDAASAAMGELRDLGIRIAIDDFGTGWSSLSYLGRLPVDILKIDRSFVAGGEPALVDGIVGLARSLGLRTIAEGIESDAQRQALRTIACDAGQGFLFARPLPLSELRPLVAVAT